MSKAERQIVSLLGEAVELSSPEERAVFLEKACAGDAGKRARVEELLRAYQAAGNFLQGNRPPSEPVATVDDPIHERPGTMIGPYKLLEEIGEGGMGLVFVAEQREPIKRRVALKVIKPGMDSRQVIARFEMERQALALMDHPHIAKVHDGGATPEGRPYFVMELVKGTPITDYCDQHRLTTRQRLQLFLDVCHAVQHAHQKGIIHRDLKPSNVLVEIHDVRPVVKVIDFGIAKATGQQLTDKTVYTAVAQMVGTPLYMSPEQAGLSSLDVDTRSDVYSLGVLLYELLTGTTPFDGGTLKKAGYDEICRVIREEELPRPSTRLSTMQQAALSTIAQKRGLDPRRLSQQLRGELDWIVMKALEKDRNRRYETTNAFAADVQRYLDEEQVLACPPSAWYRFRKFTRRNKGALAVAALVLFFLVLLGSGGLWWALQRAGAAGEARAALETALDLVEEERWPEALSEARRAEGVLVSVGAASDLRKQARELIRDLEMAEQLQEARLLGTETKNWTFNVEPVDAAYTAAFTKYGLEVDRLDSQAVAEQIQARAIRWQLVAALDSWASIRKALKREGWTQLLAVTRAADPDAWRNRLRDALEGKDPKAIEEAAAANVADTWPVLTIYTLFTRFDLPMDSSHRSNDSVAAFLARAQQRRPSDFWINENLARIHMYMQPPRWEEAIRYYTAAQALRPRSTGVRINLAYALSAKGRLDEAIYQLREAIRINKDFVEGHVNLGVELTAKGQKDEAIAEYREAIRINKDEFNAHFNLGALLANEYQANEAIDEYREAIRIRKDFAQAYARLADILEVEGRFGEAMAEICEAIRLEPNTADYLSGYAGLLAECPDPRLRDYTQAVDLAKKAVQLNPTHAGHWHTLGTALYRSGKGKEAITAFEKQMELDKRVNEWSGFYLAMTYQQLGEKEKARQWYDKAVQVMEKERLTITPLNMQKVRKMHREAADLLKVEKKSD